MNDEVDVYPAGFGVRQEGQTQHMEHQKRQRSKWIVLGGTFFTILLPSLLFIWTRPDIYQSQSIIHFRYSVQLGQDMADVPVEQITLNQQRLTSYRVLESLSDGFERDNHVRLSPERLSEILSTKADTDSRTINLYATGSESQLLQPLLETWIDLYTGRLNTETTDDTQQQIGLIDEKISALELKIEDQRGFVEAFARDNQIISAEREENRTLNMIQGLSRTLDAAQAAQAESKARLASIEQAMSNGETVIHPSDGSTIDRLQSEISTLEAELTALAEVYTAVYMQRDPEIVNKQRNLQGLKTRLEQALNNSQVRYLQESELAVVTADESARQLQAQFDQLNGQAQQFNEQLEDYKRHLEALSQLEIQSQELRDQRTELEVQRPYEAELKVVEAPFVPSFPIGPDNVRDSITALVVAGGSAVLVLLLYSLITRRSRTNDVTSYTLVTNDPRLINPQHTSSQASQQGIAFQQPIQGLPQHPSPSQRLLEKADLQALYNVANHQTKCIIALLLHGVSENELVTLNNGAFEGTQLNLPGAFGRKVPLQSNLLTDAAEEAQKLVSDTPFWQPAITLADVNAALVNSAHDAGLALPEQVTLAAVRHSYLTYIVSQGVKLNDLQAVAGYTEPSSLAEYRHVNRQQDLIEVEQVKTDYPLDW